MNYKIALALCILTNTISLQSATLTVTSILKVEDYPCIHRGAITQHSILVSPKIITVCKSHRVGSLQFFGLPAISCRLASIDKEGYFGVLDKSVSNAKPLSSALSMPVQLVDEMTLLFYSYNAKNEPIFIEAEISFEEGELSQTVNTLEITSVDYDSVQQNPFKALGSEAVVLTREDHDPHFFGYYIMESDLISIRLYSLNKTTEAPAKTTIGSGSPPTLALHHNQLSEQASPS
jgi:hypothetical protein